ncbi:MAG TPA: hypothetical protein PKK01_10455 [Mycobacterium sp.]|nr:MAG: hypothetical protein E6Q56_08655 [Mycobacterium sp.]HOB49717.1 hypothetical protein [Mycobacterium sp.]HPZ95446.1 hypothetical protein [Mycobacterium sp.]HQE14515.1 hypothetical protein [Mycobacterium sp.]
MSVMRLERDGDVFARWLALSLAVAAVRGDQTGYDEALMQLAGRTGARVRAFAAVREATNEIVDRLPIVANVALTRETVLADLVGELSALEAAHPGLTVRGAW